MSRGKRPQWHMDPSLRWGDGKERMATAAPRRGPPPRGDLTQGPIGKTLLAFALPTERTRMPGRRALRLLSLLPIITPPFVVGLAVTLLMGRNGAITHPLDWACAFEGGRWLYGFPRV